MNKLSLAKIILLVATVFLVLSIVLSVVSLFPVVTGNNQKVTIINDSFKLSQNEVYRQGLGTFHGGENISVRVDCQNSFYEKLFHRNVQRYPLRQLFKLKHCLFIHCGR